jgi:hypothetical protein
MSEFNEAREMLKELTFDLSSETEKDSTRSNAAQELFGHVSRLLKENFGRQFAEKDGAVIVTLPHGTVHLRADQQGIFVQGVRVPLEFDRAKLDFVGPGFTHWTGEPRRRDACAVVVEAVVQAVRRLGA